MLPWQTVATARSPDGTEMLLARRGEEWVVRYDGKVLMSSRVHGSEEALAALAFERAPHVRSVLVGGMGLGYTLRAALDRLPPEGRAVVAELTPALVEWNRGPVAHLAGRPLADPRATVLLGDVVDRIAEARGAWDAILLDVDNGPESSVHDANERLYGTTGAHLCHAALAPRGVLAVWSSDPDRRYVERLARAGFRAEACLVPARGGKAKGPRHVVFLGVKR